MRTENHLLLYLLFSFWLLLLSRQQYQISQRCKGLEYYCDGLSKVLLVPSCSLEMQSSWSEVAVVA